MDELVRTVVAMVLSIVLPLGVQLYDRRRMPPGERWRCWGYATWGGALYAFGALSLLGWMWVTRPRWRRLGWGIASTVAVQALLIALDAVLQLALAARFDPTLGLVTALLTGIGVGLVVVMELSLWLWTRLDGEAGGSDPPGLVRRRGKG